MAGTAGFTLTRAWTALAIILLYAVTMIAQLLGVSVLLETVIGIPGVWGVIIIGTTLVLYTMLGGLVSVARTDLLQAALICLGVVLTGLTVLFRWGGEILVLGGQTRPDLGLFSGWGDLVAWTLVWGLGIPAQSYYPQRFYAARDVKTARTMVGLGTGILTPVYGSLILIGLAAAVKVPAEFRGDAAMPYMLKEMIGGPVGFIMFGALIVGVQSTVDSLLHIVGTYALEDIYGTLRPSASDHTHIWVSRVVTVVFGVFVTGAAAYMAYGQAVPLVALIGALSWGGMAAAVAVPVLAAVRWSGATRAGAIASRDVLCLHQV